VRQSFKTIGLALLPFLALSAAPALADGSTVAAPATSSLVVTSGMLPPIREWHWDLNVDGAFGRLFPETGSHRWTGFGRARAGVMYIHDAVHLSLGLTYEYSDRQAATFGLQAEVMHLSIGAWAQAGFLLDTQPHPGFMAAVGWSLFGHEVQGREYDGLGFSPSVYLKIRVPIGVIAAGK
jgi:hypothetical protein